MPAHTSPLARFCITTWRDNEVHDCQVARDGDRACQIACIMLCNMAPLQGGDKLDIIEAIDEPDVPETSRSSHYS
jgi:hypothetical protein